MARLRIVHTTKYLYNEPVRFNEHRFMCRPRDSHDLRLLDTSLVISPPATTRWVHDAMGNSVVVAHFDDMGTELMFESSFVAEHFPQAPDTSLIEPFAEQLPFSYDASEMPDLARYVERHYPDPGHQVDAWVRNVLARVGNNTLDVLIAITQDIKDQFTYQARDDEGTQTPVETLTLGTGSCRDFALFMMEAVRSLGLAARFISGYLYDESLLGAETGVVGGGATHAWVNVYLPGAGWLPFDPTNAIVGGQNLIRVATARDPSQAAPLTGSYVGASNAYQGMTVSVEVSVEETPT